MSQTYLAEKYVLPFCVGDKNVVSVLETILHALEIIMTVNGVGNGFRNNDVVFVSVGVCSAVSGVGDGCRNAGIVFISSKVFWYLTSSKAIFGALESYLSL